MTTSIPRKRCYKCNQKKLLTDFAKNRSHYDGRSSECKSCIQVYKKEWHKRRVKTGLSITRAMRIVGLSRADYTTLYEQQDGRCAICGCMETARNQWGVKKLAVDHDHMTGEFRGLICQSCNVKLAVVDDRTWMQAASEYLKRQIEVTDQSQT